MTPFTKFSLTAVSVVQILRSRRFLSALPYVLLATFPLTVHAVFNTPGQFSVSANGSANYSIPIQVPPGTAGMAPRLSLNYSSRSGNSILGLGWGLSGLSQITRCPSTIAQDGVRGGINFDANDKFCLDGQRLIATSGTYGADSTQYRTELESFAKVVSYGTAGSGPAWFKAWTKGGQIIEYGNTADSRIEAQGKTSARTWGVNRISDAKGNYLTVSYTEDSANGEAYVSRIDYTGNANTGLAAYASVQFAYETRTDTSTDYLAGSVVKVLHRMTDIKAYNGATLVKDYRLSYANNGAYHTNASNQADGSLLTKVQECDGGATPVCQNPTNLAWTPGTVNTATFGAAQNWNLGGIPVAAGDVNGDGRMDVLYSKVISQTSSSATTRLYVAFSTGSGFTSDYDTGEAGDGFLLKCAGPASTSYTGSCTANTLYDSVRASAALGDVNGDGKADLILTGKVRLSTGNGFGSAQSWSVGDPITAADVNGDGLDDVLYGVTTSASGTETTHLYIAYSTGSGFAAAYDTGVLLQQATCAQTAYGCMNLSMDTPARAVLGDVNGDGKADLLYNTSYSSTLNVKLSNGNSLAAAQSFGSGIPLTAGDVNGDGRADVAYSMAPPSSTSGNTYMTSAYLANSTGTGLGTASSTAGGELYYLTMNYGMSTMYWGLIASGRALLADLSGDGQVDRVSVSSVDMTTNGAASIALHLTAIPDQITTITGGLGEVTTVSYKPLSDGTVYTAETGATYPTRDLLPAVPLYVVSSVSASDGIGGSVASAYIYGGAKVDLKGRGFLGFRWTKASSTDTGLSLTTFHNQSYPYIGLPSQVEKRRASDNLLLSAASTTYASQVLGGTRYFPYASQTLENHYELDGSLVTGTTTTNQYDGYGNPTQITVNSNDGYVKTTVSAYANDTVNWFLGHLLRTTVTSTMPSAATLTRVSAFDYDAASGLLTKEIVEPDDSSLCLVTGYGYDSYGNQTSATARNCNGSAGSVPGTNSEAAAPAAGSDAVIETRTSSTTYDTQGRFPISATNALSQTETRTWNGNFGTVASLTGPNNLATTWTYDSFGRPLTEARADGTSTATSYIQCDAGCPANAKYKISTTQAGSPGKTAYYDMHGRAVRSEMQGFDGTAVYADTQYDKLGRISKASRLYKSGASPVWATTTFDVLGRPVSISAPDDSGAATATTVTYSGYTTATTNAKGQSRTEVRNSQGQLVSVTDAQNKTISYQYDPFGNLAQTTDAQGNVIAVTYDKRGRKLGMNDPDLGNWSYAFDALGQIKRQTDAKAQTVTFAYDKLGRMTSRSEPDLVSTWGYDACDATLNPAGKCIGRPVKETADNGYARTYLYDAAGRPTAELDNIDTGYGVTKSYDSYGRVANLVYPTGLQVANVYNATGYLAQVKNASSQLVYWQGNTLDAEGRVLTETYGNSLVNTRTWNANTGRMTQSQSGTASTPGSVNNQSYVYDSLGNLTQRYDAITGLNESFGYDSLNRLTATTAQSGTLTTSVTLTYDAIGNILTKSDVGSYTYGVLVNGVLTKPHAVTQIMMNDGVTQYAVYTFDANGNQTSGAGRTLAWTSWNMPGQITGTTPGKNTPEGTASSSYAFVYNSAHERVKETLPDGTVLYNVSPRVDTGIHVEKRVRPDSTITYVNSLYAGSYPFGAVTTDGTGAILRTRYYHTDHLGSIVAITDEAGNVAERRSYDAWGKRRNSNGSAMTNAFVTPDIRHGYTGHEELDDVGLIHMNGRQYDPAVGRLLSADPIVQYPDELQSFNRYSYLMNNPLSAIDPSGYAGDVVEADPVVVTAPRLFETPEVDVTAYRESYSCNYGCYSAYDFMRHYESWMAWYTWASQSYNPGTSSSGYAAAPNTAGSMGSTTGSTSESLLVKEKSSGVKKDPSKTIATEVSGGEKESGGFLGLKVSAVDLPTIPQGVADGVTGFGDGAYKAVTLGIGDLQEVRNAAGISGGIDTSSSAYNLSYGGGILVGGGALGGSASLVVNEGMWGRGALGIMNQNQYLRVGYGKGPSYSLVIRTAGQWVDRVTGTVRSHIDLIKLNRPYK